MRISPMEKAEAIARDAVNWIARIRHANTMSALNVQTKSVLAECDSRGVCKQIRDHIDGVVREVRDDLFVETRERSKVTARMTGDREAMGGK